VNATNNCGIKLLRKTQRKLCSTILKVNSSFLKYFTIHPINTYCISTYWFPYFQSFSNSYHRSRTCRHSDECLVKILHQNTQGVSRSKSQTESEQNWFFENKTSWLFFPVSYFCDLFMDVPPYLGANNIWKQLCEFFQRNTDPEWNCRN